ncbi:peroxin 22 [Wolffia australiana]
MASASTSDDAGQDELAEALSRILNVLTGFQKKFILYIGGERFYSWVSVACLVVAMLYSWKLLKGTPQLENQRRRQTREIVSSIQTAGTESSLNISSNREFCSSSAESSAQDVVDTFTGSIKPTLGQLISRKLCGGRKVTCQILGVILEEKSPEELLESATVKPSILQVLSEMSKICDIYLMERVLDGPSEERIISALGDAGVFTSCGLNGEKVLFCSTENGRASFVRQLEPDWHIDTNPDIIHQLTRFIKYQLHISPVKWDRRAVNIFSAPSLELFFGSLENT